jgi:heme exporter protein D
MSAHAAYVIAAYAATALVLGGLIIWLIVDALGRRAELRTLEAAGERRRSTSSRKRTGAA